MNQEKIDQLNEFYLSKRKIDHYIFKITTKTMIKEDMIQLLKYLKVIIKENDHLKKENEVLCYELKKLGYFNPPKKYFKED